MLVTSRVALGLRGTHEFTVPPMSLPAPGGHPKHLPALERVAGYEAIRLFAARAAALKPGFEITDDNAAAVVEICHRLDGLPLAIELAAVRIKVLSPQAMLTRLQNRRELIAGRDRDVPTRQQTLRNTIEWSYDLLDEGEQQLFSRLAVLQGGRTLEGVEAVCNYDGELPANVLEGIESLVSKSLLQRREGSGGELRFWMLETIHEYAREKLQDSGEGEALQRVHARYFMGLAEEAEPHLTGAQRGEWLARLEEEHDNIRASLRWAREQGSQPTPWSEAARVPGKSQGAICGEPEDYPRSRGQARYSGISGGIGGSGVHSRAACQRRKIAGGGRGYGPGYGSCARFRPGPRCRPGRVRTWSSRSPRPTGTVSIRASMGRGPRHEYGSSRHLRT